MFTATVQDSMETKKEDNMDDVSNWFHGSFIHGYFY